MSSPSHPASPEPFIVRVDTYEDDKGHRLFDRVAVSGVLPPDVPRFIGVGQLNVEDSPVGPIHQPFNFALEADTVERAFSLFESAANAEGKQVLARISADIRRRMTAIQPAPAGALSLLGSDGVPIKRTT